MKSFILLLLEIIKYNRKYKKATRKNNPFSRAKNNIFYENVHHFDCHFPSILWKILKLFLNPNLVIAEEKLYEQFQESIRILEGNYYGISLFPK